MSTWMLLIVSALYLATGVEKGLTESVWWFGFWTSYASANICWIMATKAGGV